MRKEFLPFSIPTIEQEEINEVVDSLQSGWITTGPKVKKFEDEFKAYVDAPFAVPLNSATAGLHLALLAMGVGPGDEVITTPMTFAATVNVMIHVGAKPVLADIEPGTLNIDVQAIRSKITERTKAIVPVHFAGLPCDLDAIFAVADEFGLKVLEDAAHAVGTEYKGKRIGSFDTLSVFSFHPIKNITTGEGGMVCTRDEKLAEEISLLKFHGMSREAWKRYSAKGTPNYDIVLPGFKYNMMDIQAALGIHQLRKLDRFIEKRTEIAELYNAAFAEVEEIVTPGAAPYAYRHAWHLYTPLVKIEQLTIDRDAFMAELKKENIGTGLHFKAVHHHPYYRENLPVPAGELPHADYVSDRILSLPLFPKMELADAQDVVAAVKNVFARTRK
ncbi:MAG: DegT/DnrJ/EryC1/StrS family aminotransferase [Geobacteraceae bacterium]|nr:DegT/DnrJ/EryC1/StrS family aminotransferase [Geobacteraceae bacterium]